MRLPMFGAHFAATQGLVQIPKQLSRSLTASAGGDLNLDLERPVPGQLALSPQQHAFHRRTTTSDHGRRDARREQYFEWHVPGQDA